jgi:hypothetical protein
MKRTTTERGWPVDLFEDSHGTLCTIQVSSLADEEAHIWLGAAEIGLKAMIPGEGWRPIEGHELPSELIIANNRMHLSQSQVAELLPVLAHFAEHGVLPPPI